MPKKETDRLASIQKRIDELTAQKEVILTKQNERNDKARTNRLCKRMGMLESMLPDTIELTDEQFYTFLKRTTANDFGYERLGELLGRKVERPAEKPSKTTPPVGNVSAEKPPTPTEQSSVTVGSNSAGSTSDAG